jgi:transcriptional regulator with XRE-family HTH domain
MNLARRIRDLRYAKGWGPDDLAGKAKISKTALYQIESGRTEMPRAATLRRLARALNVAPEKLIEDMAVPPAATVPELPSRVGPPEASLRAFELERKFRELLASPLGEGLARIVEESYRLLSAGPTTDRP